MAHEQDIGYQVRKLDNMMMRNLFSYVKKHGENDLTVMHEWILGYLYENQDHEIFQKELETAFSIGRSSVTNILSLMEKKGYLVRQSVKRDARLKKLVLTPAGERLHLRTVSVIEILDKRTKAGIPPQQLHVFFDVIEKLKANLEKQREENEC